VVGVVFAAVFVFFLDSVADLNAKLWGDGQITDIEQLM
jgi:hypothetical protein